MTDDAPPKLATAAKEAAASLRGAVYHPGQEEAVLMPAGIFAKPYRIIFAAFDGCGGSKHDFAHLAALKNAGVPVGYVNVNPLPDRMPVKPTPPGEQLNRTFDEGMNLLARYGLSTFDSAVVLVNPDGRAIGRFDSHHPKFVQAVSNAIQADKTQHPQGMFR